MLEPLALPRAAQQAIDDPAHIVMGGPEQVSHAEIVYEQQMAAARHKHAGRGQVSSVVLTDEVLWPAAPTGRAHGGKSTQSDAVQQLLTDQLPKGVGAPPPAGYFVNANGQLQPIRAHASTAARSQITPTLFGASNAAADAAAPPEAGAGQGKAQVHGAGAQRSIVDALVFGHQHGSRAHAEASLAAAAPPPEGKRRIEGRPSAMGDALRWQSEGHGEEGFGGAAPSAHAMGMGGGHQAYEYVPPLEKPFAIPADPPPMAMHPPPSEAPHRRRDHGAHHHHHHHPPQTQLPAAPDPTRATHLGVGVNMGLGQLGGQYGGAHGGAALPPRGGAAAYAERGGLGVRPPPHPSEPSAGQLLYDQEQRRWVSRDGVPARYDPLLKGMAAAVPSAPQPVGSAVGAPPLRYGGGGGGGGGLRHPKLWMTTAQKEYGVAPMSQMPPLSSNAQQPQPAHARGSAFTRAFAPPVPGGGFN